MAHPLRTRERLCDTRRGGYPDYDNPFWYINSWGKVVEYNNYTSETMLEYKNFLGIWPTQELAEQALAEIKRKLQ